MPPSPVPKGEPFKVPQAFAHALALHTQGRLHEAERIYTELLVHRPDHFDALQMLSVIKFAKGQPSDGPASDLTGDAHAQTFVPRSWSITA